jgi:UDP-3-O-[3-hydroxymyristoyl] N-acetylglucosamine deacetylase
MGSVNDLVPNLPTRGNLWAGFWKPMRSSSFTLEGIGLRSGRPTSVVLHARPGPFAFRVGGVEVPLRQLVAEDIERATAVRAGTSVLVLVEHLLAACAAFGAHEGLLVEVQGDELPLLDGGSLAFVRVLDALDLPAVLAPLTVARDETVSFQESRYTFRRAKTTEVAVTIAFDDPRLLPHASWTGDRDDFITRIASARTFVFAHEVEAVVAAGQVSHVDPASVVVLAPDRVLVSGAPFTADEPARHKLLDLMGDLFLYGGPPLGSVHAFRPGHRATHRILREARRRGIVTG